MEWNVQDATKMTSQAMGHLSPLQQPGNSEVDGTQSSGFPSKAHPEQKSTSALAVSALLPSSYIHLLTCPGAHLSPVALTLAAVSTKGGAGGRGGRLYPTPGHHLQIHYLTEAQAAVFFFHSPNDSP